MHNMWGGGERDEDSIGGGERMEREKKESPSNYFYFVEYLCNSFCETCRGFRSQFLFQHSLFFIRSRF